MTTDPQIIQPNDWAWDQRRLTHALLRDHATGALGTIGTADAPDGAADTPLLSALAAAGAHLDSASDCGSDVTATRLWQTIIAPHCQGQSAVMALLDITNLQIAGRVICVTGYGPNGQSVARAARAMGAQTVVVSTNPVDRAQAFASGFRAMLQLPVCDVVFATSDAPVDLARLSQGVILCAVDADALPDLGAGKPVRDHVTTHAIANGTTVKLIAGGAPIAQTSGAGMPHALADLASALWLNAALATSNAGTAPMSEAALAALWLHLHFDEDATNG
ncbi:MAG: hypothetical protein P8H53_00700 [Paracoccaceae bacterium]|jgi:hypothetical protein|nr:hypothetical protein [Paracoccaceae bacterium]